jgi:hypothetical protein
MYSKLNQLKRQELFLLRIWNRVLPFNFKKKEEYDN